jgi:hypothetical protein
VTDVPDLDAWSAGSPQEVHRRLVEVSAPRCVVGGWAVDLFLGTQTREHEDLEIEVPRGDFHEIRAALDGFELYVASGEVWHLPKSTEPPVERHQVWVYDVGMRAWRLDVMLGLGDRETWTFRRNAAISAPRREMVRQTDDGIPYVAPAPTLLYKAKHSRPKDIADFDACLPRLGRAEREWLAEALQREHPDHPWIARLA